MEIEGSTASMGPIPITLMTQNFHFRLFFCHNRFTFVRFAIWAVSVGMFSNTIVSFVKNKDPNLKSESLKLLELISLTSISRQKIHIYSQILPKRVASTTGDSVETDWDSLNKDESLYSLDFEGFGHQSGILLGQWLQGDDT